MGRGDTFTESHSAHCCPRVDDARVSEVRAPRQLLTDQGPEFESELFTELMKWMEIQKLRTTAYHPACNGVVERFHRTLNSMLGKMVNESQKDWDTRLPLVLAAYRATPHDSTGFSPNKLFFGRELRMPIDVLMDLPPECVDRHTTPHEYLKKLQDNAADAYRLAREKLRACAQRRKHHYDLKVKSEQFKVGDWVYYHYPRRFKSRSLKWQKSYTGPYLIVRLIEPVNCVLQKSHKAKPFVAHFDKLKRCEGPTAESWLSVDTQ